jgi:hypothetical protein
MAGSSATTRDQIAASHTPEQRFENDMNVTESDNTMGLGMQSFGNEARNATMITHMANI